MKWLILIFGVYFGHNLNNFFFHTTCSICALINTSGRVLFFALSLINKWLFYLDAAVMETGQGNSESTTVTQKILREEDGSGSIVLPGTSREEVCTMGLSYALSLCPKSRKIHEFWVLFWIGTLWVLTKCICVKYQVQRSTSLSQWFIIRWSKQMTNTKTH